jgi:hypothetical protein
MGTIEEHRRMLADAEADLLRAKEAVQELDVVVRFHRRKTAELESETPTLPGMARTHDTDQFARMKLPAAMEALLRERGRPMHADQIATQLVRGGYPRTKSLKVSIATTARRRGDLFVKTGRNTFGLCNGAKNQIG